MKQNVVYVNEWCTAVLDCAAYTCLANQGIDGSVRKHKKKKEKSRYLVLKSSLSKGACELFSSTTISFEG